MLRINITRIVLGVELLGREASRTMQFRNELRQSWVKDVVGFRALKRNFGTSGDTWKVLVRRFRVTDEERNHVIDYIAQHSSTAYRICLSESTGQSRFVSLR